MSEITLFPAQLEGKEKVLKWFEGDTKTTPIFRLFGYAGTGKTTVIREIIKDIKGVVLFAAYTGKAALVMKKNGLPARTLHSLMYIPILPDKELYNELKTNLASAKAAEDREGMKELYDQLRDAQTLSFELNDESLLHKAALLVLDECSMVNDEMLADLLTFNTPILVLGDPGQLPPIHGTGALILAKPDVMFTEIHRQALDNPIINMSFRARTGKPIALGDYGDSSHIKATQLTNDKASAFDQILTGKNTTRRTWNRKMRKLLGFEGTYPAIGDKLICLKNQKKLNLFNGLICEVKDIIEEFENFIEMTITTELGNEVVVRTHRAHFDEYSKPGLVKSLKWWDFRDTEEFDFGYAITVHKSQGSQWDNVGFYDDKFLSWKKPERCKWLYTGITRAAENITLIS